MSNKKKRMAAQRRKEALKSAPAAPKGQKEESVKVNPEQPKKVPTKNKVKIAAACLVCAAVIYGAGTEVYWAKQPSEARITSSMHEVKNNWVKFNHLAMDILSTASYNATGNVKANVYVGTRTAASNFEKPLMVVLDLGDSAQDERRVTVETTVLDERTKEFVSKEETVAMTNQTNLRNLISETLDEDLKGDANRTYQITETSDGLIILVSNATDEIMSTFSYIISENEGLTTAEQFDLLQQKLLLEKVNTVEGGT